jgi:hypothetical protein
MCQLRNFDVRRMLNAYSVCRTYMKGPINLRETIVESQQIECASRKNHAQRRKILRKNCG